MATDNGLNNYTYWGLVGKGVSQATASFVQGNGQGTALDLQGTALDLQAGGYAMSAEAMDIQAEQALINAELGVNARMTQFEQAEASNVALVSAMGKTSENTIISDNNREAAYKDANAIRSAGLMQNISARSAASANRSAVKQANISAEQARKAADGARTQAILGAVGSVAGVGMQAGMIK